MKTTEFRKLIREEIREILLEGKLFTNFRYEKSTNTIRTVPENYWVATVDKNGNLKFDSFDKAIKGKIDEDEIKKMWKTGKIKRQ